ncbi:MAG: type II secretion system F family protein [Clostridiales Family XIII bacterium]|jgi:type IV pilus assembly protein PilC|nr:type II secretion system F family protein [Clostridiales Family XIII bacterium]
MAGKLNLSAEELAAFSAQLALTVKTGIPLSEAVMILRDEADTEQARKLLGAILGKLEMGGALADALRDTGAFPAYMTQMVEIGEASGRLDNVLDSLQKYYEREDNISKSAKSAITYPAIMLVILVVIIVILVTKVLPIFDQVFETLGVTMEEMTPLAAGAMRLGNVISSFSLALVVIIVVIAAAVIILRLTKGGRLGMAHMAQKLFHTLSDRMAAAKFASGMALMLASGLDVDRSLELTEPLMDNPVMRDKVERLRAFTGMGGAFTEGVVDVKIFTGMQARMLTLGFKSGNLDVVMDHIADDYEKEVDDRLDRLISIIEPTMVAILCVIVGLILLSAMLPLLGAMSSIL